MRGFVPVTPPSRDPLSTRGGIHVWGTHAGRYGEGSGRGSSCNLFPAHLSRWVGMTGRRDHNLSTLMGISYGRREFRDEINLCIRGCATPMRRDGLPTLG